MSLKNAPKCLVWLLGLAIFLAINVPGALAQAVPKTEATLDNAERQSAVYVETFKNLLAEEQKSFDIYDKKGELRKHRVINSTFVVYPLSKDSTRVTEYRNVTAVDGRPQTGGDKRAADFFGKLVNASTSQKELESIRAESLRFDEEVWISGLTLFPSFVIRSEFRPFFEFTYSGMRELPDGPAYVIKYRQIKPNPAITVNKPEAGEPNSQNYDIDIDASGELDPRVEGTLEIDAATGSIASETRRRTVRPAGFDKPVVAAEDVFSYRKSDFGIFTPVRITHTQYRIRTRDRSVHKDVAVTFEYGKFSKPDVEVKSADVKTN